MAAPTVEPGLTSVVVVAADSGPLLLDAVASVLAPREASVEVVVVDNDSSDGEPERLVAAHSNEPRLRVLRQDRNLGFGPACNRGAAAARGDMLLFLNPDCCLDAGALASLRAVATTNPRLGLLGVEVTTADGRPARGNRRRDPTLRRAVMTMTGLARLESRWPSLAGVEMPARTSDDGDVEPVEAVSGACLFLPRSVFEQVGGFDEAYFLHVEDLDLCRRVRDSGRLVAIVHGLHARHEQGSSSRRRPLFVAWHKHRGMWRYFTRFDPAAHNLILRALVGAGIWGHFVLMAPLLLVRRVRA